MLLLNQLAAIAILAFFPVTRASLYPTKPTAATWYSLSIDKRGIDVRWRDSSAEPHADTLGQLQVQLLGSQGVVTELWPLIDSWDNQATVYVPKRVALASGSDYYLRFVPNGETWRAIYTASFTIINSTAPPVSDEAIQSAKNALSDKAVAASSGLEEASATNAQVTNSNTIASITSTSTRGTTASVGAASALGTAGADARDAARYSSSITLAVITFWPLVVGVGLVL